MDFCFKLKK